MEMEFVIRNAPTQHAISTKVTAKQIIATKIASSATSTMASATRAVTKKNVATIQLIANCVNQKDARWANLGTVYVTIHVTTNFVNSTGEIVIPPF